MAQPRAWLAEITDALIELGGQAPLTAIYRRVEERSIMNFDDNKNVDAKVRGTLEAHSSDSDAFQSSAKKPNNGDLFYSVHGKGRGTWGIRNFDPKTKPDIPGKDRILIPDVFPPDNEDIEFVDSLDASTTVKIVVSPPGQVEQKVYRYIRDTQLSKELKAQYDNTCQICGIQLFKSDSGTYSEAHHIRPLKFAGLDISENLIVLCPNHHAEFDYGGLAIDPDTFRVIHKDSNNPVHDVKISTQHEIYRENIEYHLKEIFKRAH